MIVHALALVFALSVPSQVRGSSYVVQRGDNLGQIAARYRVSVVALAAANGIMDPNRIQTGRVLAVPGAAPASPYTAPAGYYQVQWGDTLIGLSARFHVSIQTIRALNPSMGRYPLAGQSLNLCVTCSAVSPAAPSSATYPSASSGGSGYLVQRGDTLSGIAARFGVSTETLQAANHIANANNVVAGARLIIPSAIPSAGTVSSDNSWQARSLISAYARQYGLAPSLPLSVGAQESGYSQAALSRTGAIGVMQVEPYTGREISRMLGRPVNLYSLDDNVHAGVFWLAHLLSYYGGDERLAVAAYYQGTDGLARHGFFQDTTQYVNSVMSFRTRLGG